jgi:hypothetical protein
MQSNQPKVNPKSRKLVLAKLEKDIEKVVRHVVENYSVDPCFTNTSASK